jgi:hypothetical protein
MVISIQLSDALLKRLYHGHRQLWLNLGKPIGFFWAPKEVKRLRQLSTLGVHNQILFGRITLPEGDSCLKKTRKYLVVSVIISVLGGIGVIVGFSFADVY